MGLKLNDSFLVVLCLTVSAALFYFGTGLSPAWVLIWLAPIPVLWLSPRVSAGMAFLVAMAAYVMGGFNTWFYMRAVTPLAVTLLSLLAPACLFGLVVLLFRYCVVRGRLWQGALVVPSFWVVYEYVTSLVSIHGTIGNLGYTQMNFVPILQVAAVTGMWGISFSIFFFAAVVAVLLSAGPSLQKQWLMLGAAAYFLCVFGYGAWRLADKQQSVPRLKVALIESDDSRMMIASTPEQTLGMYGGFGDEIRSMDGQGIQMFVLPEHSGSITDALVNEVDAKFGAMAKDARAFIAVGVDRIGPKLSWNQERLYSPDGRLVTTYDKHHLLPHWEDQFTPSSSRATVKEVSGTWGLQICKDMDFPRLSREYSRDGVGLMIVPGWDFTVDGWSHGRIAMMRGVEDGFSVARSAKKSIVYATDDRGRVLAQRETGWAPFTTVVTWVPVHHDETIYSRWGDWFAWLNVLLLAGLVGIAVLRRGEAV